MNDDPIVALATKFGPILRAAFPKEHSRTRFDAAHALAEAALATPARTDDAAHAGGNVTVTQPDADAANAWMREHLDGSNAPGSLCIAFAQHRERHAQAGGDVAAMREALKLARPIVEADYHDAVEHSDGDWEGMSKTALDAIDAALPSQEVEPAAGVKDGLTSDGEWDFAVGDPVEKFTGEAQWSGWIASRYMTRSGKQRYVVEVDPQGFQMIAAPSQLRSSTQAAYPTGAGEGMQMATHAAAAMREAAAMIADEKGRFAISKKIRALSLPDVEGNTAGEGEAK